MPATWHRFGAVVGSTGETKCCRHYLQHFTHPTAEQRLCRTVAADKLAGIVRTLLCFKLKGH
jgi:hypothetical protein